MNNWLEQCNVTKVLSSTDRYQESAIVHEPSGARGRLYQFWLLPQQNEDVAWNDFHIHMDLLKKAESLGSLRLLHYGIEESKGALCYYYAVETGSVCVTWPEYEEAHLRSKLVHEQVRAWLQLVSAVANLHNHGLHHGYLNLSDILCEPQQGEKSSVRFAFPSLLLYRLRQIFMLPLPPEPLLQRAETGGRSYRTSRDDVYSLGVILFTLLFPGEKVSASPEALFDYQERCDVELYGMLNCMLFPEEGIHLATIFQMADNYFTQLYKDMLISLHWNPLHAHDFAQEEMTQEAWEARFIEDTLHQSYLYTGYDARIKESFLHVVGQRYEWTMVTQKKDKQTYVFMHKCQELQAFERERKKERGTPYVGQWTFQALSQGASSSFFQWIKEEGLQSKAQYKTKLHQRETLAHWEEFLKLQQSLLQGDDRRFAYSRCELIREGHFIRFDLMAPVQVPFPVGAELVVADDAREQLVGLFVEQQEQSLVVELARNINTGMLPTLGDIYENQNQRQSQVRKQRQALQKFRHGESFDRAVHEALLQPEQAAAEAVPVALISTFQPLNDRQSEALKAALGTNSLFLLQGPPGTGKTTWIAELILQLFKRNAHARILLSSQSNVAIDHAFLQVAGQLDRHGHAFRHKPSFVRIGNERISEQVEAWRLEATMQSWVEELEEKANTHIWRLLNDAEPDRYFRLMTIFDEWKERIRKQDELRSVYLGRQPLLIGATCMGSHPLTVWEQSFDWVIIDEAGRATPPETLIPAMLGKRVVFVGDHKQLPPVIDDLLESKRPLQRQRLEVSLFEDLFSKLPERIKFTLNTQYRMHPTIAALVSKLFYPETPLLPGIDKEARQSGIPFLRPLMWVDIDGKDDAYDQRVGSSKSYFNWAEIDTIRKVLERLNNECSSAGLTKSVAVITGYSLQKQKLRDAIQPMTLPALQVEVDTIDAFQGKEADVALYSLVRNNGNQKIGFIKDERRLNVMISRAREALIIAGSRSMVDQLNDTHPLRLVLEQVVSSSDCAMLGWKEVFR